MAVAVASKRHEGEDWGSARSAVAPEHAPRNSPTANSAGTDPPRDTARRVGPCGFGGKRPRSGRFPARSLPVGSEVQHVVIQQTRVREGSGSDRIAHARFFGHSKCARRSARAGIFRTRCLHRAVRAPGRRHRIGGGGVGGGARLGHEGTLRLCAHLRAGPHSICGLPGRTAPAWFGRGGEAVSLHSGNPPFPNEMTRGRIGGNADPAPVNSEPSARLECWPEREGEAGGPPSS